MDNDNINHIQRTSRRYGLLFKILIVCIPVFDLLYWASLNHLPTGFISSLPVVPTRDLPVVSLSLAFLASLLPVSVAVYGLSTLRSLFKLYENGIMFSADNVRYFRRLGYVCIAWVVANAVFTTLVSAIITFGNPPGERAIVAQFGTSDMANLIISAIVLLISWVMDEGRKLEDEQARTI